MKALTFIKKREHSTIENVQKENTDTDANRFASLLVGRLQSTNQMISIFSVN